MADINLQTNSSEVESIKTLILEHGKKVKVRKKDFFIRTGEICDEIAYIKRGCFKNTCVTSKKKERILSFAFEDEFIGCYTPTQNNSEAIYSIQAIEDSTIIKISQKEFSSFFQVKVNNQIYVRKFVDVLAFEFLNKIISLQCDTPEERYLQLQKRIPDLFERISIKDIALHIGTTPETLSRIRARFLKML